MVSNSSEIFGKGMVFFVYPRKNLDNLKTSSSRVAIQTSGGWEMGSQFNINTVILGRCGSGEGERALRQLKVIKNPSKSEIRWGKLSIGRADRKTGRRGDL